MSGPTNSSSRAEPVPVAGREHAVCGPAAVEEALQMGCGSLVALQASLASVATIPGGHDHAEASLRAAIELVREAVADLRRLAATGAGCQLAPGFVLARPRCASRGRA